MADWYEIQRLREALGKIQPEVSYSDKELARFLKASGGVVVQEPSDDPFVRMIEADLAVRVKAACAYLAGKIAANWPKRTGMTAKGIIPIETADPLVGRVYIPFPGGFVERGTVKKPPRPIARRTLQDEKENLDKIMTGPARPSSAAAQPRAA